MVVSWPIICHVMHHGGRGLFVRCVFLSKSPHLPPIDADATDLTPHISRSVDGMTSTQVANAL